MKLVVKLAFEKETTGAVRYKEVVKLGQQPVVVTQYVRKTAFAGGDVPEEITMTIEWNAEGEQHGV